MYFVLINNKNQHSTTDTEPPVARYDGWRRSAASQNLSAHAQAALHLGKRTLSENDTNVQIIATERKLATYHKYARVVWNQHETSLAYLQLCYKPPRTRSVLQKKRKSKHNVGHSKVRTVFYLPPCIKCNDLTLLELRVIWKFCWYYWFISLNIQLLLHILY